MKHSSDPNMDDDIHQIKKKKNLAAHVSAAYADVANSLYQNKLHKCEFCDKVSRNKYTSLIHNARHIIIPLIKQTYYQCPECLYHYQSLLELNQHISIKHLSAPNKPVNGRTKPLAATTLRNIKTTANIECKPQEIDRKLDLLSSALISVKKETKSSNDRHTERDFDDNDNSRNFVNGSINIKREVLDDDCSQTPRPLSIKNRLVFEDDEDPIPSGLDSDNLLNDLTVNCTVNLEFFDAQLFATSENGSKNMIGHKSVVKDENNTIDDDSSATKEIEGNAQVKIRDWQEEISEVQLEKSEVQQKKSEVQQKKSEVQVKKILNEAETIEIANQSVHYEELMNLGQFNCAFCPLTFRNRYEKIIHETSHLNFQKKRLYLCSLCDRFICHSEYGGVKALRHHKLTKHNSVEPQRMCNDYCPHCGLRYFNYKNHYTNYHLIYVCPVCTERFVSDELRKQHVETHNSGSAAVKDNANGEQWNTTVEQTESVVTMNKKHRRIVQNMCEVCVLTHRKTSHVVFKILGAMEACWQEDNGFTCDSCHAKCFTLKIVEKITFPKETSHAPLKVCADDDRKKLCVNSSSEHRRIRKPLSNEKRLKNIRHRLKMMSLH